MCNHLCAPYTSEALQSLTSIPSPLFLLRKDASSFINAECIFSISPPTAWAHCVRNTHSLLCLGSASLPPIPKPSAHCLYISFPPRTQTAFFVQLAATLPQKDGTSRCVFPSQVCPTLKLSRALHIYPCLISLCWLWPRVPSFINHFELECVIYHIKYPSCGSSGFFLGFIQIVNKNI